MNYLVKINIIYLANDQIKRSVSPMFNESNVVELKCKLIDEVKNEIIAFLNTRGGKIYVGVNDDGTINEAFLEESRDAVSLRLSSWLQDAF
mgnify:CR=1 FL=1